MPAPIVTSQTVKAPLEHVEAAQFENDRQALLVFNPSPEADSLAEHLAALLRDGADVEREAAAMVTALRQLLESNRRERGHEHAATGHLSLLHKTLHMAGQRTRHGLSVADAAQRLRGPLRVIRKARTEQADWLEFMHASWAVKDVVCLLPSETLRGAYLRNQLGPGVHDTLLELLDRQPARTEVLS
jgi:hypothetical protein